MESENRPRSGQGTGRGAPPGAGRTLKRAPLVPASDRDAVRRRIEAGFYDTPAVAREVARRMLEAGLLDS